MPPSARRAVVIVAAIACSFLVAAPVQGRLADASRSIFVLDYFALGDSVASGRGLMDRGDDCRRSRQAYPQEVRERLEDRKGWVRFVFLACAGATAADPAATGDRSFRRQVSTVISRLSSRPTLVSITIGINDFGWSDITRTYLLLRADGKAFEHERSSVTADVKRAVRRQLDRLLRRRNVAVVLTQYFNPVNTGSILFGGPLPCEDPAECYTRTERLVHGLNEAFAELRGQVRGRKRLRIAAIHDEFHGHESPSPICGTDPPDVASTWIQHPLDPDSNSFPDVPEEVEQSTGEWRGDCFHPNRLGANAIAAAVDRAAQALRR